MTPLARMAGASALLAVAGSTGCSGCVIVDAPVSVTGNPNSVAPDHRAFQSETSLARIDAMNGAGNVFSHFVVTYNDATSAETPDPTECWTFAAEDSLDGWATSDDLGETWTRHPQLPPLSGSSLQRRHGDTWVAAWNNPYVLQNSLNSLGFDGSVVLMVSVAQEGPRGYDGPWGLYVNRMIYYAGDTTIDLTRDTEIALGPDPNLADGPKVAIRGDGSRAIVGWDLPPMRYLQITDLHPLGFLGPTPMTFGPQKQVAPMAVGSPPDSNCSGAQWVGVTHTQLAAGDAFFYAVGEWTYLGCKDPDPNRLEVYRSATGDTWERILSVRLPPQAPGVVPAHLGTQSITGPTRYSPAFVDRGDEGPSLAVGLAADGDYLLVVADQAQVGDPTRNESTRERIIQWRVPRADTCAADTRDLFSCDGVQNLPFQEIDALAKATDLATIASRTGVWESKPHVFTGSLSDGHTIDPRVGVIWYAQPYRGLMTADDEMKARTIVEAVVSGDGGQTYAGPFNMMAGSSVEPADPAIGVYFHPCQFEAASSCRSDGYYGEYISGMFQTALPSNFSILGAWGDSREGCVQQGLPTVHQHVWSGATRNKGFRPPPTCGLDSEECCASKPACTGTLTCQKGYCEPPPVDLCANCQTVHDRCLSSCPDGSCSCDCDNALCRCKQSRGCTPACIVRQCQE